MCLLVVIFVKNHEYLLPSNQFWRKVVFFMVMMNPTNLSGWSMVREIRSMVSETLQKSWNFINIS